MKQALITGVTGQDGSYLAERRLETGSDVLGIKRRASLFNTGRIDNMVKDLNAAQDLAHLTHTSMPLTAICAEVHRMLTAAGLGGEDQAALMEYFKGPNKEIAP